MFPDPQEGGSTIWKQRKALPDVFALISAGRMTRQSFLFPAILLCVAIFWSWHLSERGVYIHDEAHYLLGANTLVEGALAVFKGEPVSEAAREIRRLGGTLYFTAKPGHVALLAALGMATAGVQETPSLWLSLLAGLGVVALVYRLLRDASGGPPRAALLAALFAGTSPILMAASRSALGLTTSLFFALAAAWFMTDRFRSRSLIWAGAAGLCAFASFACHYNSIILLGALMLGLVVRQDRQRWLIAMLVFVAAALVTQVITWAAAGIIRGSYADFMTYFGELRHAFSSNQLDTGPTGDGVRGYGVEAWVFLGRSLLLGFAAAGPLALAAVAPRYRLSRFVICWAFIPLVFWALYPWKVERSFVAVAPGVCAAAGLAVDQILRRYNRSRAIGLAMVAVLILPGILLSSSHLRGDFSPFRKATEEAAPRLIAMPPDSITLASAGWRTLPQWKWYLGPALRRHEGKPVPAVAFDRKDRPGVICTDNLTLSSLQLGGENGFILLPHDVVARAVSRVGYAEIGVVSPEAP